MKPIFFNTKLANVKATATIIASCKSKLLIILVLKNLLKSKVSNGANSNKPIPIIQYDLTGKEIARFTSMNKAKQATGISLVQIARCVHGEITNASGYIFKQQ